MTHPLQQFVDREAARHAEMRERGYRGPVGETTSMFIGQRDGFNPCVDLDGTHARQFLEGLGLTVLANGDRGTNGYAITDDGWVLSTNGFLCRVEGTSYAKHPALKQAA